MAKRKTHSSSNGLNTTLIVILLTGVIVGFVAGFLVARDRYTEKIAVISQINMDKAVEIDNLEHHLEVLGAKVAAEE